jgi:hypothetical protein
VDVALHDDDVPVMGTSGLEAIVIDGQDADIPYIIVPNECFNVSGHTITMEASNEMLYSGRQRTTRVTRLALPVLFPLQVYLSAPS